MTRDQAALVYLAAFGFNGGFQARDDRDPADVAELAEACRSFRHLFGLAFKEES